MNILVFEYNPLRKKPKKLPDKLTYDLLELLDKIKKENKKDKKIKNKDKKFIITF